ncbi:hypothetical protein [Parasediminibacterium sp. JCM 36343]|uniref:hypothetical protein n=1 Tax=Parasediminibacterium sp. JCM 36343 TaxID=3374279 RepID=UPI00397BA4E0
MKKVLKMGLFFTIAIMVVACKKTTSTDNAPINLFTQQLDNIKRAEPVLLSFDNGVNTDIVNWQVTPNKHYSLSKVGVYASLLFDSAGVYNVIASTANKQATYVVTIANTMFKDADDTGFSLKASKLVNVAPLELVSFAVSNALSSNFSWTIGSSASVATAITSANPAVFSFFSGNTATITVQAGSQKQSRTIWLSGSVNDASVDTVPFIFSDKLIITPSVETDNGGNKTLVLQAHTNYNYQCSTDKILSIADSSNNEYSISYGGVVMAATPCTDITPATCTNKFAGMAVGTHPFTINFGNKTIMGTITRSTAGSFNFDWVSNNAVSIYPLTVQ